MSVLTCIKETTTKLFNSSLYQEKIRKIGIFVIPVGEKWFPNLRRISLGKFFGIDKMV